MSHVVIAGAHGLVGAHLVEAFRSRPWSVTPTARRPAGTERALDITDDTTVARLLDSQRVDVLVCAAATPGVEDCERDPNGTRLVNVEAPLRLARCLAERDVRLVVFSSEYVFDGRKNGPYVEDDTAAPLNQYGRQKLELERGVCEYPRHLAVRTSGVYGRETRRMNFVFQLLDRAARGVALPVAEDQLITPTWASSLAALTVQAVERGVSGVLHLAGSQALNRVDFARLVCEVFGIDDRVVEAVATERQGLLAKRPRAAGLSVERARGLGLGPFFPPREGLRALQQELARSQASPA